MNIELKLKDLSLSVEQSGSEDSDRALEVNVLHCVMHAAPLEILQLVISWISDSVIRRAVRASSRLLKSCIDRTSHTLTWAGSMAGSQSGRSGGGLPLSHLTKVVKVTCPGHTSLTTLRPLPSSVEVLFANKCSTLASLWDFSCPPIHLRIMDVSSSIISDLSPLSGCKSLQELNISFTRISDLSPLSSCSKLEQLFAFSNPISNLDPLASCSLLKVLHVFITKVENIRALQSLTLLEIVHINNTLIDDISPLISSMDNLKRINISDTPTIDLSPLKGCQNLKLLYITAAHQSRDVPLLKQNLGSKLQVRML